MFEYMAQGENIEQFRLQYVSAKQNDFSPVKDAVKNLSYGPVQDHYARFPKHTETDSHTHLSQYPNQRHEVNEHIRANPNTQAHAVKMMDEAFDKHPGLKGWTRSYSSGVAASFGPSGATVGKTFRDHAYGTATARYGIALDKSKKELGDEKPAVIVQHLPKGHKAFTVGNEADHEIMHRRGQGWKVMADHDLGTHREIHVKPVD
ncbi:hypothetical protein [Streptomyces sp. CoH17]|uniref:hypothetical protein n=1 Tax=Streptomyces sp. CoH17 TaxID=2992806 RepID=UPI00226F31EA|nr:hypothetical protein [Streptomyces sp. CoH17]